VGVVHGADRARVLIGCWLAVAVTSLSGACAAGHVVRPPEARTGASIRILQFNLCDSGIARCFTGQSVRTAAAVIRAEAPDVVTLSEVCRDDVSALERTLSRIDGGTSVTSGFQAAVDRRTTESFRCTNGEPYGIGLLVGRASSPPADRRDGAVYPTQDSRDPEERVWLCLHADADFVACTTHLASTNATVALAQCRYLLRTAVPALRRATGAVPVVLGGDLNLRTDGSPAAQSCLPSGYRQVDDGAVQHVVVSDGFTIASIRSIDMHGTTDHPALLVDLTPRR